MRSSIHSLRRLALVLNCVVMLVVAASALAWAWHVDLPAPQQMSAVASDAHTHGDGGQVIDVCDHCCHAGAHMLALAPSAGQDVTARACERRFPVECAQPSGFTDPPFIPPIA